MFNRSFYAMRHGETGWNAEGRFQGHGDQALSPVGRRQARETGRRLKSHLDRIAVAPSSLLPISSPLARARETMLLVLEQLGIPGRQFNTDERLMEASFGRWEGLTTFEVKERFPEERRRRKADRWSFAGHGGGSYAGLEREAREFLAGRLAEDGTCLVITHSGNLRVMFGLLLGLGREETMAFDIPHDVVFRWSGDGLSRI